MNNETEVAHQPLAGNRMSEVEKLFNINYGQIMDVALSDRRLLVADAERIVNGLANHLDEYDGPLDMESFTGWANSIVKPAALRISRFYQMISENAWAIRAGIRSALGIGKGDPSRFEDDTETARELSNEVCWLIFQYLDRFLEPDEAKTSTRLFALAKLHAGYHVTKIRRRYFAVLNRLASGRGFLDLSPGEVVSAAELAALKLTEEQENLTA